MRKPSSWSRKSRRGGRAAQVSCPAGELGFGYRRLLQGNPTEPGRLDLGYLRTLARAAGRNAEASTARIVPGDASALRPADDPNEACFGWRGPALALDATSRLADGGSPWPRKRPRAIPRCCNSVPPRASCTAPGGSTRRSPDSETPISLVKDPSENLASSPAYTWFFLAWPIAAWATTEEATKRARPGRSWSDKAIREHQTPRQGPSLGTAARRLQTPTRRGRRRCIKGLAVGQTWRNAKQ